MLRFLKIVITFLSFDSADKSNELCDLILSHVFAMQNSARYTMIIRRILNKLVSRVGVETVLRSTPTEHQKLVHYVERVRRKAKNARERQKFIDG